MCRLPEESVLAVAGEDAGRLLQGQSTCDFLGLGEGQCTLGAFCNAKGRVITIFRSFRWGAVHYVILPRELAEGMERRLRRVILRSAVHLENLSEQWLCFGAAGTNREAFASLAGMSVSPQDGSVASLPHGYVLDIPAAGCARVLFMVPTEHGEAFAAGLQEHGFVPDTPARWLLEDVRAGLPRVTTATSEEFVPQMLNLDALGGISFKKGCYVGQEVVARSHYLGRLKRRTFRLRAGAGILPEAGDPIYEYAKAEQSVGMVVLSAPDEGNGHELLAVLNLATAEQVDLRWNDAAGAPLARLALPYQTP
jgi:folate-binding protein YgfZ